MDWNRAESLISANLDAVLGKASDTRAAAVALEGKLAAAITELEGHLAAAEQKLDALPPKVASLRSTVERCDAIILKAQTDGRADLASAAEARQADAAAQADALDSELALATADLERGGDVLDRLQSRQAEVAARRASLGAPAPAAAAAPKPAAPAPKAAGGDALDDEFAALLAEMGETASPAPRASAGKGMADDDDEFSIPDLVEVGDGELPDDFDMAELDEPPAKGKAGPPSAAQKAGANAAPGGARLPVPVKGGAVATQGSAAPAKSRKGLWITVGGIVIAAGGTIGALLALGIL